MTIYTPLNRSRRGIANYDVFDFVRNNISIKIFKKPRKLYSWEGLKDLMFVKIEKIFSEIK